MASDMATEADPTAGITAAAREAVSAQVASIADPGPLGLAAFALTTFCLSMVNADLVSKPVEPIVFGLALMYGGIAQLTAGMWEFKKGNTFGATAFTSYGAFWLSFWAFVQFYAAKVPAENVHTAVALFLFPWGIFTFYMWIASFRTSMAVNFVFLALTVTFFLLAFGAAGPHPDLTKLGGWVGIVTAAAAWYASFAGVVNSTFGKPVVPNPSLRK